MSSENKPWQDEETLRELYHQEEMTCDEIGEELGCSGRTVSTWLNKNNIETRTRADYQGGPWRSKEKLQELYVEKELSSFEVADRLGCSQHCIMEWLNKHGIKTRQVGGYNKEQPWHGEELLRELYIENRMSIRDIAEYFDCWPNTILNWLEKYDIPRRHQYPHFKTRKDGYEVVSHGIDYNTYFVRVHRLVAVAHGKLKPSEFFDPTIHVHHTTGIPWDNRPEKLEVMTKSDHHTLHQSDTYEPDCS